MSDDLELVLAEAAVRRCAEDYARGADRRDKELWRAVLSPDCTIEGPGFSVAGREANLGSLDLLERMFRATRHLVHQVRAEVSGDSARGETYCTAEHLMKDGDQVLVWAIRYQDRWQRIDGRWQFIHRALIVDWEELRGVTVKAEQV